MDGANGHTLRGWLRDLGVLPATVIALTAYYLGGKLDTLDEIKDQLVRIESKLDSLPDKIENVIHRHLASKDRGNQ